MEMENKQGVVSMSHGILARHHLLCWSYVRREGVPALIRAVLVLDVRSDPEVKGAKNSPGGGSGIRTHGGHKDHSGFRDRPDRPLRHPSGKSIIAQGVQVATGSPIDGGVQQILSRERHAREKGIKWGF